MSEVFQVKDESYQAMLDISETISKSKEVVSQSKNLWNRLKGFQSHSTLAISKEYRSLDHSFTDTSQVSPTIRGNEIESCYLKENSILRSRMTEMQNEINFLNEKIKTQDSLIKSYEEQLHIKKEPADKYLKHVNLKLCSDFSTENNGKNILEEKLKRVSEEYTKQVTINEKLRDKLKSLNDSLGEKIIEDLESKILTSNKQLRVLSKRLEKTEEILSKNHTPTHIELPRKSCVLINHKAKKKRVR
jgi:flagellar biosynthesis chaperone FliJ